MLYKQKILDVEKAKKILFALSEITKEIENKTFHIDPEKGAQLTLEANIIEKIGEAGKSLHTGRSRNDEIVTAEMLYYREKVLTIAGQIIATCNVLLTLVKKNQQTIMPGYTHMQPAKPTTVGQWALSYCNGMQRGLQTLMHYYNLFDMNPLGAAESYGTSWDIDRTYTGKLLGFSTVWEMPQDVISSRGTYQLGYLQGLSEVALIAGKLAQDLLLFNTFEYGFVDLGDAVAQRMHPITGSSIMAQKKNPDVLELIRATSPQIIGLTSIVANLISNLPMGYNRDARETKEYTVMGFTKTASMLSSLEKVIATILFNKEKMEQTVLENYSLTTELADFLAQQTGIGYRIIYKIIGEIVDIKIAEKKLITDITVKEIIQKAKEYTVTLNINESELSHALNLSEVMQKRKHIGGASKKSMNIAIKNAYKNIVHIQRWLNEKKNKIASAKNQTEEIVKGFLQ